MGAIQAAVLGDRRGYNVLAWHSLYDIVSANITIRIRLAQICWQTVADERSIIEQYDPDNSISDNAVCSDGAFQAIDNVI